MENQLSILSESLDKKIQVLQEIQEYNTRQEEAFKQEEADLESFDDAMEEKERLIEKLTQLDEGFEALFERVSAELKDHREQYAPQIQEMQEKVKQVLDLSVSIQAQEARNKKLVEDYFAKARNGLKQNRQNSRAAYDYYKNMSGSNYASSQYMDSKQ